VKCLAAAAAAAAGGIVTSRTDVIVIGLLGSNLIIHLLSSRWRIGGTDSR